MLINEYKYLFRQPIVLIGLFFLVGFAYLFSIGVSVDNLNLTSQLTIKLNGFVMLTLPIAILVVCQSLFLRDHNSGMSELVFVTPVKNAQRWLFRWFAALLLLLVIYAAVFVIISLPLLSKMSLLTVSNILITQLICTVIVSSILLLSISLWLCNLVIQKANKLNAGLIVTLTFIIFWLTYIVLSSLLGSPILAGSSVLSETFYSIMLWADPYGITAVFDGLNTNLESTYNTAFYYYINRMSVLIISAFILYQTLRESAFKPRSNDVKVKSTIQDSGTELVSFKVSKVASPFLSMISTSLKTLLLSPTSIVILFLWLALCFNETLSGLEYAEPQSILMPNSIDALNRIAFDIFPAFSTIIIAFWSWQLCWREHTLRFAEIVASAPVSNNKIIAAHSSVIAILAILIGFIAGLSSLLAEIIHGSNILLSHYMVLISLKTLPVILIGGLFVCIHHFVKSKAVAAGLLFFTIIIKFTPITTAFGLTHTLWNIADSPLQAPSNYWGFANSISLYAPYMLFWFLFTGAALVAASYTSHRGTGLSQFKFRTRQGKPKFTPLLLLICFAVLSLAQGVNLHNDLVSEKPLTNSHKREAWKAKYEQTFGHFKTQPQPVITHVKSLIDLYPSKNKASFNVTYTLTNKTDSPIEQVLVSHYPSANSIHVLSRQEPGSNSQQQLQPQKVEFEISKKLGQTTLSLLEPLAPKHSFMISFELEYQQPKLWPIGFSQFITPELTYLRSIPLLPVVGYQTYFELSDPELRKAHELPALKPILPSLLNDAKYQQELAYEWASMETVISTEQGQYALAQGELTEHFEPSEKGHTTLNSDNVNTVRPTFVYKTLAPIRAISAWLSFPENHLQTFQSDSGIAINLVAPNDENVTPGERRKQSINMNVKAINDTLSWFEANIAPYNGSTLSLISIPELGATGYALPHIMFIADRVGFRAQPKQDAPFDQRYRRAVHETAHQWFGHSIGNSSLDNSHHSDSAFLIESMAKYMELVLIEKHRGKAEMQGLVEYEYERFMQAERSNINTPKSLIDATESHHSYSRATLAFAVLRAELGDEVIINALKQLWKDHSYPNKPALAVDFVALLKQHSPINKHELINNVLLSTDLAFINWDVIGPLTEH
ncbi:M1 family aminopeptidase [Psychrosphaera haliotis]|nr:M1 family aminopeptidase [Psychrosphaera haliotis]